MDTYIKIDKVYTWINGTGRKYSVRTPSIFSYSSVLLWAIPKRKLIEITKMMSCHIFSYPLIDIVYNGESIMGEYKVYVGIPYKMELKDGTITNVNINNDVVHVWEHTCNVGSGCINY